MALELAATVPGAVAFIPSVQPPKNLKVLKVDGKLPGERGYPLK
jgi:hypothetical protein